MESTIKKIAIDTNWLISYLIKYAVNLHLILEDASIIIYSSSEQFKEFERKISEDKFRKYFALTEALDFLQYFKMRATEISLVSIINLCRDAKDNYLLSLSKDAKADYLITGDKDLIILKKFETTLIVTLPQFLEIINKPA